VEVFWVATLDMHNLVEKMGVGESPTNEWCGNKLSIVFSAIVSYGSIQGVTEFAVTTIQGGRMLTRSSGELLQFEAYKRKKLVYVKQDCNHHVGPSLQAGHIETLNDYMDFPHAFMWCIYNIWVVKLLCGVFTIQVLHSLAKVWSRTLTFLG
jgi:hypothetical protein